MSTINTVSQMQKKVWLELKTNPHFTKCPNTKPVSKWKDFKRSSYYWTIEYGMDGCFLGYEELINEWLEEVEKAEWEAEHNV